MGQLSKEVEEDNMPEQEVTVISSSGEEIEISVDPSSTVEKLKDAINYENGVGIERQKLSILGWPLDDDSVKLEELLEFGSIFNLALLDSAGNKGAGKKMQFLSDMDMTVINGTKPIKLLAKNKETLKLSSNKFGIVKHVEGEEIGNRLFHMRRYVVNEEGSIEHRANGNKEPKVFLISRKGTNGTETELEHEEYTCFDEKKSKKPLRDYMEKIKSVFHGF